MAKKPAQPDKPGRKTAYSPKTDEIAYEVCRQFGADDRQLALVLGVSRATVNSWKKQHPTFRAQLLAGKEIFDTGVVEQKLLARAMGYDFDEKTFDVTQAGKRILKSVTTKHLPPNVTAQVIWLTNRNGKRWKHKQTIEGSGDGGGFDFNVVTKYEPKPKGKDNADNAEPAGPAADVRPQVDPPADSPRPGKRVPMAQAKPAK